MRRTSFYPPLGSSVGLSPFQPSGPLPRSARFPRHLAPTSEGLSRGYARALDQICVKYAYKVGWKGQAARPLCMLYPCVRVGRGEGDAMIYIYVQYQRFFYVFLKELLSRAEEAEITIRPPGSRPLAFHLALGGFSSFVLQSDKKQYADGAWLELTHTL